MTIPVAAKAPATLEATMDRRKSKDGSRTGLWLDVSRGTLVIKGWPALLVAGALVASRLMLGVGETLPVPYGPEAHPGPRAASLRSHEESRRSLAPADRGSGAAGIRGSRRVP